VVRLYIEAQGAEKLEKLKEAGKSLMGK
jgi:hypothetical protein